jgi:YD repeat-containing protein
MYYAVCLPPLPPTAGNCTGNGPFSAICDVPTYQCSPSPCPTCNTAAGGAPIDLATGNTSVEQSDIRLPALGGGLTLNRAWNSQATGIGMFGDRWMSNLEERVYVGGDGLVKHARGDGSIWAYGWSSYTADNTGSVYYLAGPRNGGSTLQVDDTTWTLTLKNGDRKIFSRATGSLLSIVDRNGNTTQLSYDSANRLVTVADSASRHLYFTYTRFTFDQFYLDLVTSVTSDFGVSLSYQYDAWRLARVTKPDGTFVTFEYASNLLTAVRDSEGKILESHAYDAGGRGLTSSRAGGIEAITVSY